MGLVLLPQWLNWIEHQQQRWLQFSRGLNQHSKCRNRWCQSQISIFWGLPVQWEFCGHPGRAKTRKRKCLRYSQNYYGKYLASIWQVFKDVFGGALQIRFAFALHLPGIAIPLAFDHHGSMVGRRWVDMLRRLRQGRRSTPNDKSASCLLLSLLDLMGWDEEKPHSLLLDAA